MPGEINCLFTKGLIPFVEKEAGTEAVAAVCRAAGRPRDYLMADHNWLSLAVADEVVRVAMALTGDTDVDRWARRMTDDMMDWKPSREYRHYLGTYSMGVGHPRDLYARADALAAAVERFCRYEGQVKRNRATFRRIPKPGHTIPRWFCVWENVKWERYPTNWGLPRAVVTERQCVASGAATCVVDVRWRNPRLGARFWGPVLGGGAASIALVLGLAAIETLSWTVQTVVAALPVLLGGALGYELVERGRRRHARRLLDLQSEEILYSNNELEKKFRDLETTIDRLSLISELSAAVNATLDAEKIYEQALERLVHGMGYQNAYLFRVDRARRVVRGHRMAGATSAAGPRFETIEFRLDDPHCGASRVAASGLPLVIDDVESTTLPVDVSTARSFGVRSVVMVPLRVKDAVFGVLNVTSSEPGRVGEDDLELLSAVANHVALAVDRAESFQTIEDLSRGLEDKVRVRTEQLRTANEELQAAYRELQATQVQLVQREKMASVGQLVAGVAHELNNPIGFVYSNVTTLEDFARRLRAMLDAYRAAPLPEELRGPLATRWETLKIDYALKYLDSMIQGIKEGAERARKIVRDLRIFARTQDDVWQSVDLHEELESSLTLLSHLLKDRVDVHRKFGELGPVECIRSQVDQVFLNLLANAAQAITGPGAITIETRQEGGVAVVAIADTGPGIPPEIMGRLFDPFFTTKPVGEGTGLGLSISYEIAKKHGGELRAESPPGSGAVFILRIPVARSTRA